MFLSNSTLPVALFIYFFLCLMLYVKVWVLETHQDCKIPDLSCPLGVRGHVLVIFPCDFGSAGGPYLHAPAPIPHANVPRVPPPSGWANSFFGRLPHVWFWGDTFCLTATAARADKQPWRPFLVSFIHFDPFFLSTLFLQVLRYFCTI